MSNHAPSSDDSSCGEGARLLPFADAWQPEALLGEASSSSSLESSSDSSWSLSDEPSPSAWAASSAAKRLALPPPLPRLRLSRPRAPAAFRPPAQRPPRPRALTGTCDLIWLAASCRVLVAAATTHRLKASLLQGPETTGASQGTRNNRATCAAYGHTAHLLRAIAAALVVFVAAVAITALVAVIGRRMLVA